MIIFVTQKQAQDKYHQSLDCLETGYLSYFRAMKLFPSSSIFIPIANNLENTIDLTKKIKPDVIIFTGGNNVVPQDKALISSIDDHCQARDQVEAYLHQYCDNHHIFRLAICRGFQFLNVYYGGTLKYFLEDHSHYAHECLFEETNYTINSYHQHGILTSGLAENLAPIVLSERDKVVEAYINSSSQIAPILGVQWHPEREAFREDLFLKLWEKYYKL